MCEEFIRIVGKHPWIIGLVQDIELSKKGYALTFENDGERFKRVLSETNFSRGMVDNRYRYVHFFRRTKKGINRLCLYINCDDRGITLVGEEVNEFIKFCKSEEVKRLINFL